MESGYEYEAPANPGEMDGDAERVNTLNLSWVLGIEFNMIDGVHNLTNEERTEIFYASAHTGVIFDYRNKTQRLLQGHCNRITCTAYCQALDLLVTGDSGADSMLVVWDAKTGVPRKTIFQPHPNGVETLDVSADGRYIITLSKETRKGVPQTISLWDLMSDNPNYNLITNDLDSRIEYQTNLRFSLDNCHEFASTGGAVLVFWSWTENEKGFEYYCPKFSQDKRKLLTQTAFIPGGKQAVSGTNDGYIVVWDISLIMEDWSEPDERREIKMINIMNSSNKSETAQKRIPPSINILKIHGNYLVIGASNGAIRFYDFQYRIIAWFEDINVGRITSISFANADSGRRNMSIKSGEKEEANKDFESNCPEFIVVDTDAQIRLLKPKTFESIDLEKKKGETILESIVSPIQAIAVRPTYPIVAICCVNGYVYEWNYNERNSKVENVIPSTFHGENIPTCIQYSPDGKFLIIGTNYGQIYVYDSDKTREDRGKLAVLQASENSKTRINMITFASDSKHFATMDSDICVCLFRFQHKKNDPTQPMIWDFAGKVRVHTLPIRSLCFGESLNEKKEVYYRLFSIGEDKRIVEYNVHDSDLKLLKVESIIEIEQESNPTACVWYPINMYTENLILTANQDYKLKLWNVTSPNTQLCKLTGLGPTHGGPINKFLIINQRGVKSEYEDVFLAYSTAEKVVGIIKLPLQGNPNQTIGLIAHPEKITSIECSGDGKLLFTSGAEDKTVNIWRIDLVAMTETVKDDNFVEKLPRLLEGGFNGQVYRDLKDFFYYAQIRSKDENTTKARKLDGKVPFDEIANLMRAMGYYPTHLEIENMKNEIKYSKFYESGGQFVNEIDCDEFVRLFVNHRPVYGVGREHIEEAINEVSKPIHRKPREEFLEAMRTEGREEKFNRIYDPLHELPRDELLRFLETRGEKMKPEEIKFCINTLMGEGEIEDLLPEDVTGEFLIKNLLQFEEMGDAMEQMGSMGRSGNPDDEGDEVDEAN